MIGIGINENVYLAKAEKDEKGTLVISLATPTGTDTAELKKALEANPFADWEEGGTTFNEGMNGINLRIFSFDAKAPVNDPEKVPDATEMRNRIAQVRDPLAHILLGYMTKDKMPLKPTAIFKGTGIDKDINTFGTKIMSEDVQAKVYANIVDLFIEAVVPYAGKEDLLFRVKLPRQSAKKAYATFPTRFISDDQPFWESMSIPAESSKVKFSTWEKNNGFDKADAISQKAADKVAVEEPEHDPFMNQ